MQDFLLQTQDYSRCKPKIKISAKLNVHLKTLGENIWGNPKVYLCLLAFNAVFKGLRMEYWRIEATKSHKVFHSSHRFAFSTDDYTGCCRPECRTLEFKRILFAEIQAPNDLQ